MPYVNQISMESIVHSRARNISDLLFFEFFGQWQIVLDFVKNNMNEHNLTIEDITKYSLYLYHATFQQRKRMEEISAVYENINRNGYRQKPTKQCISKTATRNVSNNKSTKVIIYRN